MLIFLVGYMGCGKSTIGRTLAKQLGVRFLDMDTLLEQRCGKSVAEIFTETGETGFRQSEREVLAELTSEREAIVATGGGAPCFFDNMETMNRAGLTVYFKMSPEKLAAAARQKRRRIDRFYPRKCRKTRKVLHAGKADHRLRRSPGRLHRTSHRRIHRNEKRAVNPMKNLFYLLILAAVTGCSPSGSQLSWRQETFGHSTFTADSDYVEVSYPVAAGGRSADSINRKIADRIKTGFGLTDEEYARMTPQQATDSLLARKNRDPQTARLPYDLRFHGEIRQCGKVTSLRCTDYTLTGGAHGLLTNLFFNFDTESGKPLDKADLFSDTAGLQRLNRQYFAKHLSDAALSEDALFVGTDQLPLPENVGIDSSGVTMLYNPYEVAPYAIGTIEYRIPYEQAEPLLKRIARR